MGEPKRDYSIIIDVENSGLERVGKSTGEARSRRDDTSIDIRDAEKLSHVSFMPSECCIFKVPNILKRHDSKAYMPNAFSIGPLHHGEAHLKATERQKQQYLHSLISRIPNPTKQQTLENLIEAVRDIEGNARECYAATVEFDKEEFTNILLLDGCFVIELFRKHDCVVSTDHPNDPPFDMACIGQFLPHDLILLENQIPWFVLECLFKMTSEPHSKSLTQLTINFFDAAFSWTPLRMNDTINHGSKHILDLLRNTLVLSSQHDNPRYLNTWKLIPSAKSLKEAGIKFKRGTDFNILNITFNDGVLEIPPLLVKETTNSIFRNLISFEQCYPNCTTKITSYAIFLDNLINTTKDVNILAQEGIIDNWTTPDDVLEFLSKLYYDTYVSELYYSELCNEVSNYCKRWWPRWRAAYVQNHFAKPWVIISEVVAAILLLLTILQTIFTIIR